MQKFAKLRVCMCIARAEWDADQRLPCVLVYVIAYTVSDGGRKFTSSGGECIRWGYWDSVGVVRGALTELVEEEIAKLRRRLDRLEIQYDPRWEWQGNLKKPSMLMAPATSS